MNFSTAWNKHSVNNHGYIFTILYGLSSSSYSRRQSLHPLNAYFGQTVHVKNRLQPIVYHYITLLTGYKEEIILYFWTPCSKLSILHAFRERRLLFAMNSGVNTL